MVQAAKYPALLAALADFFGEKPSQPANELVLNTGIDADDLSIVATANIPASWPASGRLVIDGEVIAYDSFAAATFTVNATGRGKETAFGAGAAAAHTAGAAIGSYLTAEAHAQILAEIVAIEAQLGKNFMKRQAVTVDANDKTVDFASGDYAVCTLSVNWGAPVFSNPVDGHVYVLRLVQDATGSRTWTPPAAWLFPGGTKTLSTGANDVDIVTAIYDSASAKYYASLSKDYS